MESELGSVPRSESGLEPDWAAGDRDLRMGGVSTSASASASGSGSTDEEENGAREPRLRNVSSSSTNTRTNTNTPGPSASLQRPITPPPHDENLLGVGSRWAGDNADVNGNGNDGLGNTRSNRMIGRSPPPPPGPPPSDPPPLPPASSHPFAAAPSSSSSSSSSRPKPSARLSSLSSIRKANLESSSRPSSPAGPPPMGDLPPLPIPTKSSSHSGHSPNPNPNTSTNTNTNTTPVESAGQSVSRSSAEGGRPGHSRKVSDTPPQVSPRSSSLFMSQQAGPSNTNTGAGPLGTPIVLSSSSSNNQAQSTSHVNPNQPRSNPQPTAPSISAPAGGGVSSRSSHPHSHPHSHSTSNSLKPPRTPSRHLLQTALDLAQRAVEMDKSNDVVGALAAYREAVSRLKAVMERVGVEPTGDRRRRSGTGKSEEEGRTLRGIHDAYVARIQLLSSYETNPRPGSDNAPSGPSPSAPSAPSAPSTPSPAVNSSSAAPGSQQPPSRSQTSHPAATSTSTLLPPSQSQNSLSDEGTPRPSLDDGGMAGIGNFMLSDPGDQSFDTSMASPPRKLLATTGTSTNTRRQSDTRSGSESGHGAVEMTSQPSMSISGQLGQTGSSSPSIPVLNGNTPRDELSLQQALDRAADASSNTNANVLPLQQMPIQPRRESNASIGLGYPSSSPSNMVRTASTSTPSKGQTIPRSQSEDGHGSPSSSKLRLKRPARPSLGLEMETDLSGIDGVDEEMEVLARTPRESYMPIPLENGPNSDPRRIARSASREPDSPQSMNSTSDDHRPLPPLPDSAPSMDAMGQPVIKTRKASLSGASVPLRPPSGSGSGLGTFLVSPTILQGTISQRRQSRPVSGNMSAALEQMQIQAHQYDDHQHQHQHQRSVTQLPIQARDPSSSFPVSSSNSSIRSTSASSIGTSIGTRIRAKSQPGNRPSIHGGDLPPVPPATLRHKASFSSSSQLGTGIIPQIQRQSVSPNLGSDGRIPSSSGGLRINTEHAHSQSGEGGVGGGASGLAPPITIASRTGSPRSLPPLPDTAVGSILSTGAGSLISPLPESQPMEVIHRPFHLLRIIHSSMDPDSSGSYLTGAIHISSAVWNPTNWSKFPSSGHGHGHGHGHPSSQGQGQGQGGNGKLIAPAKIMAQETKVRCIEALILHFEAVRFTGQALLSGPRDKVRTGKGVSEGGKIAEEFCVALDELDEEMDNTHKSLVKQGVSVGGWKGKKTGGNTKSWGSRISRSMDKMTNNSKNDRLDSTDKYVDLLAHLCGGAQIINDHLLNFTSGDCTTSYALLPDKGYRNIEARLRRTSEFVGAVIVPFVLDDFKQFFLRYLKGGVRYLED
ncbi:hypothetical protein IAT40_000368 [Kwoniella sp. CBS 6097]